MLLNVTFVENPKFQELFDEVAVIQRPHFPENYKNVVVLWGGADIATSLYDENHWQSGERIMLSRRDTREMEIVCAALNQRIPIIAVCRGAQFICAMASGKLIQHVYHHAGQHHEIKTDDGRVMMANSYHHQMCYLEKVDHELIAWAHPNRSPVYYGAEGVTFTRVTKNPATRMA